MGESYQLASDKDKEIIHREANNLRVTNDTITNVIFMNNSSGEKKFGHSAVLLINEYGEGFLFSYNPDEPNLIDNSEVRYAVLSVDEVDQLKNGTGIIDCAVTNNGNVIDTYSEGLEQYDRFVWFPVSKEQGQAMYQKAADIFCNSDYYFLKGNNCDNAAHSILQAGGIEYEIKMIPNETYNQLSEGNVSWENQLWHWRQS